MDPVFTIPYPEYVVAGEPSKLLPKAKGYSVNVPLSRQQKGFDLLVYSFGSRKAATIQIKSSRAYPQHPPKRESTRTHFRYGLWFNNFKHEEGAADFYILFGLYPLPSSPDKPLNRRRKPSEWADWKILCFSDSEMKGFLASVSSKSGKSDRFFGFGFNEKSSEIILTRGGEAEHFEQFLLKNKIHELERFLK
jgi:hypothetical protein